MSSVVEIIVVIIGILVLGGIGYLAVDMFNTHKESSADPSFTGVLRHAFNTIKSDVKTGYHMTGVDIKTGSEVVGEDLSNLAHTVGEDITTGAEMVGKNIETGAEVIESDVKSGARHLTGKSNHESPSSEVVMWLLKTLKLVLKCLRRM